MNWTSLLFASTANFVIPLQTLASSRSSDSVRAAQQNLSGSTQESQLFDIQVVIDRDGVRSSEGGDLNKLEDNHDQPNIIPYHHSVSVGQTHRPSNSKDIEIYDELQS